MIKRNGVNFSSVSRTCEPSVSNYLVVLVYKEEDDAFVGTFEVNKTSYSFMWSQYFCNQQLILYFFLSNTLSSPFLECSIVGKNDKKCMKYVIYQRMNFSLFNDMKKECKSWLSMTQKLPAPSDREEDELRWWLATSQDPGWAEQSTADVETNIFLNNWNEHLGKRFCGKLKCILFMLPCLSALILFQ